MVVDPNRPPAAIFDIYKILILATKHLNQRRIKHKNLRAAAGVEPNKPPAAISER